MFALKFLLFLASLGLLGFFVIKSLKRNEKGKLDSINFSTIALGLLTFFFINFFLSPSFGQVPAGHRGVVLEFGKVTNRILGEGLYMVTPFVNSVELMDVQVHAASTPAAAAARSARGNATAPSAGQCCRI